jgi:hypothetical protein
MRCVILQLLKSMDMRYVCLDSGGQKNKHKGSSQCFATSSSTPKKKGKSCCSSVPESFWAFFDLIDIYESISFELLRTSGWHPLVQLNSYRSDFGFPR